MPTRARTPDPCAAGGGDGSVIAAPAGDILVADLQAEGRSQEVALERLHALLLRAARFEIARRRPSLPHLRGDELDEIALEAADDATLSVLRRLDEFRGESRF